VTGSKAVLQTVVKVDSPADLCGGQTGWVFPARLGALTLPSVDASKDAWAAANHGIPASGNHITVVLQAGGDKPVVVDDLRVSVVRRSPAPKGTYPLLGSGCGGLVPTLFKADLDKDPVTVKPVAGVDLADKRIPPVALPQKISPNSPEQWRIAAVTHTCDCEWVAFFDYTANGATRVEEIDDRGRPFRTVSPTNSRTGVLLSLAPSRKRFEWQDRKGHVVKN
jgi:hypothetical protein